MGDCTLVHDEVRISVRDPEKTELWVYLRGVGDCPYQCIGWRYKAFPPTANCIDVIAMYASGEENPLDWERKDPPPTVLNYSPDWDAIEADLLEKLKARGEQP